MCHYRTDYLECNNDKWLRNIIIKKMNGEPQVITKPVVGKFVPLPKGIWSYEEAHARGSWAE
jgi:hypothetical protein